MTNLLIPIQGCAVLFFRNALRAAASQAFYFFRALRAHSLSTPYPQLVHRRARAARLFVKAKACACGQRVLRHDKSDVLHRRVGMIVRSRSDP
ncbi:MAG: hypothetical protein EPO20_16825 [Betaproteobacteria bacterium]|nr:MAG: hypothetical protein EPO20_16825 [Betaproteobacteria bacterium]